MIGVNGTSMPVKNAAFDVVVYVIPIVWRTNPAYNSRPRTDPCLKVENGTEVHLLKKNTRRIPAARRNLNPL